MNVRKAPQSESVHCPMHDERSGYDYPSCSPDGCPFVQQAQLLEDRAVAIQFLVEGVLEGLRANSDEVTSLGSGFTLSLSAALEAARILARSITDDADLIRPGEEKVRWVVLNPKMMMQPEPPPARFDAGARKEK